MAPTGTLGDWVRLEFKRRYPHEDQRAEINWDKFTKALVKERPAQGDAIRKAVKLLQVPTVPAPPAKVVLGNENLEAWVHQNYLEQGFKKNEFKGFAKLTDLLVGCKPALAEDIRVVVKRLRKPGSKYSFGDPMLELARQKQQKLHVQQVTQQKASQQVQQKKNETPKKADKKGKKADRKGKKAAQDSEGGIQLQQPQTPTNTSQQGVDAFKNLFLGAFTTPSQALNIVPALLPAAAAKLSPATNSKKIIQPNGISNPTNGVKPLKTDLISRKIGQMNLTNGTHMEAANTSFNINKAPMTTTQDAPFIQDESSTSDSEDDETVYTEEESIYSPTALQLDLLGSDDVDEEIRSSTSTSEIRHAPIVSKEVLDANTDSLPQYGSLGIEIGTGRPVYQNTNIPFSSFICGVQGSGKSHTTSCMLENAIIPSHHLGRLENPLSALIFAYDDFNSSGNGFSVSEAAFLAVPNASIGSTLRAKKVTILVSPSNPSIAAKYNHIPNVTVIPFRIDPRTLDVNVIITLMAVDPSGKTPLYLAQVIMILRELNVQNNGCFDYAAFKQRLKHCDFNPVQENMLKLRLDLLESFLDLRGNAPQPKFRPGEITIMDMSCPFVDENTACILFKIELDHYLQSSVPGKMVVLDEAHKYMLKVPGAKELEKELLRTIRLQRHKGVRLIISTQEPTLLTGLIALCDVTVIHRFSSPEWFNALKRHIPMQNRDEGELMEQIEALRTGTALVFAGEAVYGRDEHGVLEKGTGRLVKIRMRKRVTADGGMSVLAT